MRCCIRATTQYLLYGGHVRLSAEVTPMDGWLNKDHLLMIIDQRPSQLRRKVHMHSLVVVLKKYSIAGELGDVHGKFEPHTLSDQLQLLWGNDRWENLAIYTYSLFSESNDATIILSTSNSNLPEQLEHQYLSSTIFWPFLRFDGQRDINKDEIVDNLSWLRHRGEFNCLQQSDDT